MANLILVIIVVWIVTLLIPGASMQVKKMTRWVRQRFNRLPDSNIFDSSYIEPKAFYLKEFGTMPCISYIGDIEVSYVFDYIKEGYAGDIVATYQRNYFSWQNGQQEFYATLFKLNNRVLIKLGAESAEILFDSNSYAYAQNLIDVFKAYKMPEKKEDFEINIITSNSNGLDLKPLNIEPTHLDIDLYYNDDFKPVDELIRKRLGQQHDKGIILLHGLPGTGKTTYLRHLIGGLTKKVLFVSPAVAGNLMNPELIDILIDNANSVLVIEDAENIIMDRKIDNNSSVSNLLNISDGLLSDCLNVQIICTFNNALSLVDPALMRKGRLIARYEFGKLTADKAQRLSDELGFESTITTPMTIATIANQHETDAVIERVEVMGFRRSPALQN